jgi:parallel beta-helix repeat protein
MTDPKKPGSIGIHVDGGSDLNIEGNIVDGHDVGIRVSGDRHNVSGNIATKPATSKSKWIDTALGRWSIAVAAGVAVIIIAVLFRLR